MYRLVYYGGVDHSIRKEVSQECGLLVQGQVIGISLIDNSGDRLS